MMLKKESLVSSPVSDISGTVDIPGDKSISQRALCLGAMAKGTTTVSGFLLGQDCISTMEALSSFGVKFELEGTNLRIISRGLKNFTAPKKDLDLGNSGTGMRLLMGLLSSSTFSTRLSGDNSLSRRPMERLAEPLRLMGARIKTSNGCAPVEIIGSSHLKGINYDLPAASAQLKSAILLASLNSEGRTVIRSPGPSRDHTERMFKSIGIDLNYGIEVSIVGPQELSPSHLSVPKDFSSAAFFIVAGLLNSKDGVLIPEVNMNYTRIGLLKILENMGARFEISNKRKIGEESIADIFVKKTDLKGLTVDPSLISLSIDELPILFIAAACAEGITQITGAKELRFKESDRISAMSEGLKNLGVKTIEKDDGIVIYGGKIKEGIVDSLGDHRIAMSFVIAGMKSEGDIYINNTKNIDTSFPDFVDKANKLGLKVIKSK